MFWNGGWWKGYLRGKPYYFGLVFYDFEISCCTKTERTLIAMWLLLLHSGLLVVDLKRLRETGVGDAFRATYMQWGGGQDSLANMDQDILNLQQHRIPTYTLPQVSNRLTLRFVSSLSLFLICRAGYGANLGARKQHLLRRNLSTSATIQRQESISFPKHGESLARSGFSMTK